MKKKSTKLMIGVFLFLVVNFFLFSAPVEAAFLKFDQTTATVTNGTTYQAQVVLDAGTDQITSTDVWVRYDPTLLEAQTVASGTFFPTVTNNVTSGKVYIAGLIVDPGTYKTGSGTVATITFKALKNGSGTLTYDCRTDVSNSSKIIKNDVNATNIIVCSQNLTQTVTVGGSSGSSITPTSTPAVLGANPTAVPTALPQSGIMDNFNHLIGPGLVLFLIGIALRLALL